MAARAQDWRKQACRHLQHARERRTSSGSVKVTYLDLEAIRKELGQAVRELASRHPEIERVLLFGSLATGRAVPGSDADLLIMLKSCDRPFLYRIAVYTPEGCSVGIDVFPYTEAEVQRMLAAGTWLLRRALGEGVELPLTPHPGHSARPCALAGRARLRHAHLQPRRPPRGQMQDLVT